MKMFKNVNWEDFFLTAVMLLTAIVVIGYFGGLLILFLIKAPFAFFCTIVGVILWLSISMGVYKYFNSSKKKRL